MVNTWIIVPIVPTADDYPMSLGGAARVCGVVIGAMAVAQLFSSVYFSAWSNISYFKPLIFTLHWKLVICIGFWLDSNSCALDRPAVLWVSKSLRLYRGCPDDKQVKH
ncbi:LOW QUALITY PROTEIN: hypothetical protein YC2023_043126 [Brassica napus]